MTDETKIEIPAETAAETEIATPTPVPIPFTVAEPRGDQFDPGRRFNRAIMDGQRCLLDGPAVVLRSSTLGTRMMILEPCETSYHFALWGIVESSSYEKPKADKGRGEDKKTRLGTLTYREVKTLLVTGEVSVGRTIYTLSTDHPPPIHDGEKERREDAAVTAALAKRKQELNARDRERKRSLINSKPTEGEAK